MADDPFAFQVERLTQRHRHRHTAGTVAEVVLQQWLAMRRRYNDPFAVELFDHIDVALAEMPSSVDPLGRTVAERRPGPTAPDRRRVRSGRSVIDRPVSRSV